MTGFTLDNRVMSIRSSVVFDNWVHNTLLIYQIAVLGMLAPPAEPTWKFKHYETRHSNRVCIVPFYYFVISGSG